MPSSIADGERAEATRYGFTAASTERYSNRSGGARRAVVRFW